MHIDWPTALPVIFMALMGVAMLAYVILDGYDLGVGLLLHRASDAHKDVMISSIGPFWDANETWLVLGVGILLVAFPKAHGIVLTALYLPVALMLIGLILRGVAFDFRVKAEARHKPLWNTAFFAGSALAALSQGWMLGRYITGFAEGTGYLVFAAIIAVCLPAAYVLLGCGWLIMKTEGELQRLAVRWGKTAWTPVVIGMALISMITPWVSETVNARWFSLPAFFLLMPIPLATGAALVVARLALNAPEVLTRWAWVPFAMTVALFLLGGIGLAYSLFPYVVMDRLTLWEAASSTEALSVILVGAAISVPAIVGYTIFAYRVFWGKATELHYG